MHEPEGRKALFSFKPHLRVYSMPDTVLSSMIRGHVNVASVFLELTA